MKHTTSIVAVLPLLLGSIPSTAFAGGAAVFVARLDGSGSVRVYDVDGSAPPVEPVSLREIRLLPIDFVGRHQLLDLDPTRPRRREDVPGAARLELPGGMGSLYHFVRGRPHGTRVFGYFVVEPTGNARVLLERESADPTLPDAFLERVAVAPNGGAFLAATVPGAGGDVYEVPLTAGAPILRTSALSAVEVLNASMALTPTFGAVLTTHGLLRFERAPLAATEFVNFDAAAPQSWFGEGIETSQNGAFGAVIASATGPLACRPFVFGATGKAKPASSSFQRYVGTGHEPDALDGPYLALTNDGAQCAWRGGSTPGYLGEVYYGTTASAPDAAIDITDDARFEPYLDEVGLFVFRPDGRLLMGVGEWPTSSGPGLAGMDLFEVSFPSAGSVVVTNLSRSSGQLSPPFLTIPTLAPTYIRWLPEADAFLLHVPEGIDGRMVRVPALTGGMITQTDEVESVEFIERVESDLVFSVVRENGSEQELREQPSTLATGSDELESPEDEAVRSIVRGPPNRLALRTFANGVEKLHRLHLDDDHVDHLPPHPDPYGATLTFSTAGAVVFSYGPAGFPSAFCAWTPSGTVRRLNPLAFRGFVLPSR